MCLVAVLFIAGCGKEAGIKTEFVEGVVTLDGTPIGKGCSVRFIPVTEGKGEAAGGFTDEKSVYTLSSMNGAPGKGAVEGEYKIVLTKRDTTEFAEGDPKAPKDDRGNSVLSISNETLHQSYTLPKTTPLTYTVVKGKQKHDIELVSKP